MTEPIALLLTDIRLGLVAGTRIKPGIENLPYPHQRLNN
jgi:hypothetical protein